MQIPRSFPRALGLILVGFAILMGYQNCSQRGVSFSATPLSLNGSTYMVVGVTGTRYVGGQDTFTIQSTNGTVDPQRILWTVILPISPDPVETEGSSLQMMYVAAGEYRYNVRVIGTDNQELAYNFVVQVLPRPDLECSEPGGVDLRLTGPSGLSLPGRAGFEVFSNPLCFPVVQPPVWRVLNSAQQDITNQISGNIVMVPNDRAMEFTFASQGSYTVEAEVLAGSNSSPFTIRKTLVVSSSAPCDPNDISLTYNPKNVPGIMTVSLNLPSCFDTSTIARYDWDFNYDPSQSSPEAQTQVPGVTYNFKNTEGMVYDSVTHTYSSVLRITIHHRIADYIEVIDRVLTVSAPTSALYQWSCVCGDGSLGSAHSCYDPVQKKIVEDSFCAGVSDANLSCPQRTCPTSM